MATPQFLYDTCIEAERALPPVVLSEAICTAIRLGKNALEQEWQAAFLVPLARINHLPPKVAEFDADMAEIISACLPRPEESQEAFIQRLIGSSNLSAMRVVLAQLFEQEYGEETGSVQDARERRKSIRTLCKALPAEVWSGILQGDLKLQDADFFAITNFNIPLYVN